MKPVRPSDHCALPGTRGACEARCITSCGRCDYCRKGMYSHCETGGWILGNSIDGIQAEFVRIPHADTSLLAMPAGAD